MKGARGTGDTIPFIDSTPVIDSKGQSYPRTFRRVDCDVIRERVQDHSLYIVDHVSHLDQHSTHHSLTKKRTVMTTW